MEVLNTLICSTAHLTADDNDLLGIITYDKHLNNCSDSVLGYRYGYLIRLYSMANPLEELKQRGVSKSVIKLISAMMNKEKIDIIIFDCDGDCIDGFDVFDW